MRNEKIDSICAMLKECDLVTLDAIYNAISNLIGKKRKHFLQRLCRR